MQLAASATTVASGQSVTLTATVAGNAATPAGQITLLDGANMVQSATMPSSDIVSFTLYNLTTGTHSFTAYYTGDGTYAPATSPILVVSAVSVSTPTVTVNPSQSSITTTQALSVAVNVAGAVSSPVPTGTVNLAGGGYISSAAALQSGTATFVIPAGTLATGSDILTASYAPDTASSLTYGQTSGMAPVTVTAAPNPSFTIGGASVTLTAGATTANTSIITVTPAAGFTGSVMLTAAITSSPTGAQKLPTFAFGSTNPVSISGSAAGTTTLTISSTAGTTPCTADKGMQRGVPWYAAGGMALACTLLFGISGQRRKWRTVLGMFLLLVALAGGMASCGGGGGRATCTNAVNAGTTAGTYIVAITGTSGATTQTGTITLTVQ